MARAPIKKLNARHRTAAMLRARGETWERIAKELGVGLRTVYEWNRNEEFRALIDEYQRQAVDLAESILIDAVPAAAREMARLATEAGSERVRVAAGKEVLDRAGVGRPSRADEAGVVLKIVLGNDA